jgi:hypothetical protein
MCPMKLPQLTLRDLFWLVLVCALVSGWWVDHMRLVAGPEWARQQELLRESMDRRQADHYSRRP